MLAQHVGGVYLVDPLAAIANVGAAKMDEDLLTRTFQEWEVQMFGHQAATIKEMANVVVAQRFHCEVETGGNFPWFGPVFELEANVVFDTEGIRGIRHSRCVVSVCPKSLSQHLHLAADFVWREQETQRSRFR